MANKLGIFLTSTNIPLARNSVIPVSTDYYQCIVKTMVGQDYKYSNCCNKAILYPSLDLLTSWWMNIFALWWFAKRIAITRTMTVTATTNTTATTPPMMLPGSPGSDACTISTVVLTGSKYPVEERTTYCRGREEAWRLDITRLPL